MGILRDEGKAIAERSADEQKQRHAASSEFGGVIIRV
jgi:hypothetical protein